MSIVSPPIPRMCCESPMFWEWGEPDSQWDQGYPTSWHCQKCGCSEKATSAEIKAQIEYEDLRFQDSRRVLEEELMDFTETELARELGYDGDL